MWKSSLKPKTARNGSGGGRRTSVASCPQDRFWMRCWAVKAGELKDRYWHQLSTWESPVKPSWVEEDPTLFFQQAEILLDNPSMQQRLPQRGSHWISIFQIQATQTPPFVSLMISWSQLKLHFPKAIFSEVAEGQRLAAGCHGEPQKTICPGWLDFHLPQGYFLRLDALKSPSGLFLKVGCSQKSLIIVRFWESKLDSWYLKLPRIKVRNTAIK